MKAIYKKYLLFLGLCIPLRFLLAYMAKVIDVKYYKYTATLAIILAIGWLYFYFVIPNSRGSALGKAPKLGASPVWWNKYRIIHAALYITYAVLAYQKNRNAYVPLLIDPILGLIVFMFQYFI